MNNRLLEICNKVLEINETAEEYVAIFADGGWDIREPKEQIYFIFKDGNGFEELMQLTYEDYVSCRNAGIIKGNSYGGFKARAIYEFDINKVKDRTKELKGEEND